MTRLLAAAVLVLAAVLPGHADVLPTCVKADKVNDRCEQWQRRFNDGVRYEQTIDDDPAAMVRNAKGDRLYVATTTSADAQQTHQTLAAVSASSGATLWLAHAPSSLPTTASVLALAPDQSRLVVSGTLALRENLNATPILRWYTVAYSASNGRPLWQATYDFGGEDNRPVGIVVTRDRVYVTGYSEYRGGYSVPFREWLTVAYSTRTGKRLWRARYGGVAGGGNAPVGLAVSPRGDRVYVGGYGEHPTASPTRTFDYTTIAYRASDGRQVWRSIGRYGTQNTPTAFAMSPRGDRVFLTGTVTVSGSAGYQTVALATTNGRQRWVARYVAPSGQGARPTGIAVSPRGDRVYVTGTSGTVNEVVPGTLTTTQVTFATVAYDAATGRSAWTSSYVPQGNYTAIPSAVAVSPSGGAVYVSGTLGPPPGLAGYAVTVAYTASGAQSWAARYDLRDPSSAGTAVAVATVVAPTGRTVYVAGRFVTATASAGALLCANGVTATSCRQPSGSALLLAYAG